MDDIMFGNVNCYWCRHPANRHGLDGTCLVEGCNSCRKYMEECCMGGPTRMGCEC